MDDLIGLQEIADMAGVTREAVRYWVRQGKIPSGASIKDHRGGIIRYRIRRADAEAFIAARRADGRYVVRRPRVNA